jgi:hypothetical protein
MLAKMGIRPGSLLNLDLIASVLTRDAPWSETHDAAGDYLGVGLLYYTVTYATRAKVAVCLGSGGGFVPRLMRQAQRDAGIGDSARTILVDGDIRDGDWGSPQWLDSDSFFRVEYPDVEIVLERTSDAAEHVFAEQGVCIDYLHIDADHSFDGCLEDFVRYRPYLHVGSLVTLHDTNLPGAGVEHVLDLLRARPDCELLDIVEAGTGTALLRISSDDPAPDMLSPLSADEAAVPLVRQPDTPPGCPPSIEWRYLRSPAFSVRNVLAAHFVRDCPTVVEIGGWRTPIDRYLTGPHSAVVVVDPAIPDATRDALNGAPCHVRHARAGFQDLRLEVLREREYGLVLLGLDLVDLTEGDEQLLFELVRGARTTVIEFASTWGPTCEQYARILAACGVEELVRTRIDLDGNDFGDLTNSWQPRTQRALHVLGRRAPATASGPVEAGTDLAGVAGPWQRLMAGDASAFAQWSPAGGEWCLGDGGVRLVGSDDEWAALNWRSGLAELGTPSFALELTVAGRAEAAGISFGPYRDLLAPLAGRDARRVHVEVDADWGTWSLHVDGRLAPRAWWNDAISSTAEILGGGVALKARNAGGVTFRDLSIRSIERTRRLSVVLTCSRFLQRLRCALRTWCEQAVPEGSLEILVVNPESPDGTAEHLAAVSRAWQHVRVREVRVSADLATNKGTMINNALDLCEGSWVWLADADCLFPPFAAREALHQAQEAPRHLYFMGRRHLSRANTDAILGGRLDPVRDFERLAATTRLPDVHNRAPHGYTQLFPRAALDAVRYDESVNHFAYTDQTFVKSCTAKGYPPRELDGLFCLHLDHPFAWNGTKEFL